MKLNSKILGLVVLVVIFGGIALSAALGWWQTEGGGGQASGTTGEGGELIRGKTTFQELLDLGVQARVIEQVIGARLPDPTMRIKIYCDENGLDFETIKEDLLLELEKVTSEE